MGAVLVYGLVRYRRANTQIFGILSAICGAVVVVLLNRERGRVQNEVGLIAAQLTGWFWLAFISAIVIVMTAVTMLIRGSRTREN
jgi:predicted Co/Zn/Cd cation transporter (cation efflux family)